jgi:stage IV sporulation protein FB
LALLLYGVAYLGFGTAPSPQFLVPQDGGVSPGSVFSYLALVNAILAVFNLIPAFPMDGGRVLRGLLAARMGMGRATDVAAAVGQVFAVVFFLVGLLGGNFILILIAVFVFFGAQTEVQMVRQREMMRGLTVGDVMANKQHTETVSPYHTFGQVLDRVIHGFQEDFPVVDEGGSLVGMLTRAEILAAAHSPGRFSYVCDLMKTEVPTTSPAADLFAEGARILQGSALRAIPVVEGGKLVGMLTIEDFGNVYLIRG